MSDWSVTCPKCGEKIDSHDSYGDSRAMLRLHIENKHPQEEY